jgi:hypothetical protein
MKRKICLLLFVIQIMAIVPSALNAQSVEEHPVVVNQTKIDNTLRFTLDIERDSALCMPSIKIGECYVLSQKIKKYVFVDITRTPYITSYYAQRAFESPNVWVNVDTSHNGAGSTLPEDFETIGSTHKYSSFPWLVMTTTHAGDRYYHYNKDVIPARMEKDTRIETYSEAAIQSYILWIIILAIVVTGVWSLTSGKFINLFEQGWVPGVLVALSVLIIFVVDFCINGRWPLYPTVCGVIYPLIAVHLPGYFSPKDTNNEPNKNFYEATLYFLVSLASAFSLLFWSVNKFELYYGVMPITAVIAILPIIPKFIPTSIKDDFYRITGW